MKDKQCTGLIHPCSRLTTLRRFRYCMMLRVKPMLCECSPSLSTAPCECGVSAAVLPKNFVMTPISIPDRVAIFRSPTRDLPEGWNRRTAIHSVELMGTRILLTNAVLEVPSAIVPEERIYVLNPAHPESRHIRFLPPEPFRFDPQLK